MLQLFRELSCFLMLVLQAFAHGCRPYLEHAAKEFILYVARCFWYPLV